MYDVMNKHFTVNLVWFLKVFNTVLVILSKLITFLYLLDEIFILSKIDCLMQMFHFMFFLYFYLFLCNL